MSRGILVLVLGVLVATGMTALHVASFAVDGTAFRDWNTYAVAVQHWLAGEPIYAPEQLAGPYTLDTVVGFGYAYPPTSVPLFVPFAFGWPGLVLWLVLNIGALLSGLAAVIRRELGTISPAVLGLLLVALGLWFPFTEGVAAANVNVGLAGVFAWAWARGRGGPAWGPVAGLLAIEKVLPGVLVAWSDRPLRAVVSGVAVAGALVVVTLPLVGFQSWVDFTVALRNAQPLCGGAHVSVACTLGPVLGFGTAKLAGIVLGGVLALAAMAIRAPLPAYVALAGAWLAPVTDMHLQYVLIVFVLLVVVVSRAAGRRGSALPTVPAMTPG